MGKNKSDDEALYQEYLESNQRFLEHQLPTPMKRLLRVSLLKKRKKRKKYNSQMKKSRNLLIKIKIFMIL